MRSGDVPRPRPSAVQRERDVACLTQAIDVDVIPRLARRHRSGEPGAAAPGLPVSAADVEAFLAQLLAGRQHEAEAVFVRLRERGTSVEQLYLQLMGPAARRIGELWCDDRVDFATVTLVVGHLQRWLREWSPQFAAEREAAPHAHRALFVQAPGEQHSFGLSMLAEFFRRAGWDVIGGIGGGGVDPAERVRREAVDLVGFSLGSEPQLPWLERSIAQVRAASLNGAVVVMAGGPLFDQHPERLAGLAVDAAARDAPEALALAERLVAGRQAAP